MSGVTASLIDGVLLGAVYGLAAMGLSLIWGVMDVINLTHGAMIALGMFALYLLYGSFTVSPYLLLLPILAGGFLLGVIVYWIAVHRVVGQSQLMSLLSTFAVNMVIIGLGTTHWGTSPYNVNFSVPGFTLGRYTFTGNHLLAGLAAVLIAGALHLVLYRTRMGKAIRAVADNRDAAELMGIPSALILMAAFGIGIALAAASGGLVATLFPFTILSGGAYELKSFVVTVLAGLGNPFGALLAGILLGLLEGAVTPFIAVSWIPAIEFGLFVLALVLFPRGLFGTTRSA
ncbi:MAG TPA: branched-chain amino acid ABC transporter permease [Candidatus Acidoferrales bacterium]|nr:branched-chain amino acid ABC transporter permease [Candidatus Acidoferrales bacterium]